ncbi:MAG: tRNA (guanine(46)-N(7))-methyltransferase TrmB [Alphaproteobacteria bacterium]|nr:tRNA (guanine(46)-N(7))-methyltransferase TrmB [Alphaproteobacteria bacterium]
MEKQEIRTFGRVRGKKLSARQQWLVDNLLPELAPTGPDPDPNIILEIGFGAGEHLLHLAAAHPDKLIIGAEPFINGVASLLSQMTQSTEHRAQSIDNDNLLNLIKPEYRNIRIWPDDVRKLFTLSLSRSSTLQNPGLRFAQIWILHPDPWPKTRHEKRRLLSAEFLELLAGRLAPKGLPPEASAKGGQIIIGTDHYEYYDWILEQVKKTRLTTSDQRLATIDTRYQRKNKAGTAEPKYLILGKA